jgi:hypothetical protein
MQLVNSKYHFTEESLQKNSRHQFEQSHSTTFVSLCTLGKAYDTILQLLIAIFLKLTPLKALEENL